MSPREWDELPPSEAARADEADGVPGDKPPGLRSSRWTLGLRGGCSRILDDDREAATVAIGHNVKSKEEVDAVMAQAVRAGARSVKPAQATFYGGYAGYFQDPDDHLWEVLWNPQLIVPE